jgi:hypothetical protein
MMSVFGELELRAWARGCDAGPVAFCARENSDGASCPRRSSYADIGFLRLG